MFEMLKMLFKKKPFSVKALRKKKEKEICFAFLRTFWQFLTDFLISATKSWNFLQLRSYEYKI